VIRHLLSFKTFCSLYLVVSCCGSLGRGCPELQTVLLSDTSITGHVEAFENCPNLSYVKLDYTQVMSLSV
jgi:hypothetical protein